MMAFFDSLVQRELEGVSSDDELSGSEQELYDRIVSFDESDVSSDSDASSSDSDSPGEGNHGNTSEVEDDSAYSSFSIAFASVMAERATRLTRDLERLSDNVQNDSPDIPESERNSVPDSAHVSTSGTPGSTEGAESNRSISEIIAQKRREIKRSKLKPPNKMGATNTLLSDSSDEDSPVKVRQGHPDNVSAAQRQRVTVQLKRLRQLRSNVLNDESDSDEGLSVNKKANVDKVADKNNKELSKNSVHSEATVSEQCCDNNTTENTKKIKNKDSSEVGPYLHKSDFSNAPSTSHDRNTEPVVMDCGRLHNETRTPSVEDSNYSGEGASTSQNSVVGFKRLKKSTLGDKRKYRSRSKSESGDQDDI